MYRRRDTRAYSAFLYLIVFLLGVVFLSEAIEGGGFRRIAVGLVWVGLMLPSFLAMLVPSLLVRAIAEIANGILLLLIGVIIITNGLDPVQVAALLIGGFIALWGSVYLGLIVSEHWRAHNAALNRAPGGAG